MTSSKCNMTGTGMYMDTSPTNLSTASATPGVQDIPAKLH